ncbi:MAG TPA: rhodanese-like domain-containing protein [Chitinophagaceae bacterium]
MRKILSIPIITTIVFVLFTSETCVNDTESNNMTVQDEYVCLPCGAGCDTIQYKNSGTCSHCNMELVKKSTVKHTEVRPQELCSLVPTTGADNILLLDVRTPAEFNGTSEQKYGRLNTAINIPIQELRARIKELDAWKDKQIVVYCSHSHRSPRASYMLSQSGFTKVTNMSGGMSVWKTSVKDESCNQQLYISQ